MALQQNTGGSPLTVTATGQVRTGPCALIGLFCNSTTSGTITLYDNTSAAGQVIASFTPAANTFYSLPAVCINGVHAVVTNTLNVTLFIS